MPALALLCVPQAPHPQQIARLSPVPAVAFVQGGQLLFLFLGRCENDLTILQEDDKMTDEKKKKNYNTLVLSGGITKGFGLVGSLQ